MKRIGLALGGGGARGLAHIGVLRVLEKEKLPLWCIAGTSMGSIIGACYAVHRSAAVVEKKLSDALASSIFHKMRFDKLKDASENDKRSFLQRAQSFIKDGYLMFVEQTQYGYLQLEALETLVASLVPDIDIADTAIPFACVATDLTNGRGKVFTKGPLRKCVIASSAIPGVFPPIQIDGIYYNDGGAVSVTPLATVKSLGGELLIASNVKSRIMRWEKPEKAREIIARCNYVTGVLLNEAHLKEADVVISPEVGHMHWTAFDKMEFMIKKGEAAASVKMLEIKMKLGYQSLIDKLRGMFRFSGAGGAN